MIDHGNARTKPFKYGHCVFNRHDKYVGRSLDVYGEFSDRETALFRQLLGPGASVIEVGANIGALTVPLAQIVGPTGSVTAFEPQRHTYHMLCANAAINGLENVAAHRLCAGVETGGFIEVPEIDQSVENNFGGLELAGNKYSGESIAVVALDDVVQWPVHLIKIDVEGMEADVIRGATAIISEHKPYLYAENDRREKSKELIELLWGLGYTLFWDTPPLFNPQNFNGVTENIFGAHVVSVNMLCVPQHVAIEGMTPITDSSEFPLKDGSDA